VRSRGDQRQRASARTSCKSGMGTSPNSAAGGARGVWRRWRAAPTARSPDQRATQDVMAAGRSGPDGSRTIARRWRTRGPSTCTASVPNLPPVPMPTTTNRQRRARPSSGYVLRRATAMTAQPGWTSARLVRRRWWHQAQPGSRASKGKPFATTSMRRSCATGTSIWVHVGELHVSGVPGASRACQPLTGHGSSAWSRARGKGLFECARAGV